MAKKTRSISAAKSTPTFAGIQRGTPISTEFNPDYSTTRADLKRIGVLAGSFFALLIVLSIVLPMVIK